MRPETVGLAACLLVAGCAGGNDPFMLTDIEILTPGGLGQEVPGDVRVDPAPESQSLDAGKRDAADLPDVALDMAVPPRDAPDETPDRTADEGPLDTTGRPDDAITKPGDPGLNETPAECVNQTSGSCDDDDDDKDHDHKGKDKDKEKDKDKDDDDED